MTVLFLDFDGCTHQVSCKTDQLFSCTSQLWAILRACEDAHVVFSTSWRESHPQELLVEFCTYAGGEDLAHRFIGQTPCTPRARSTYVSGPQPTRHAECIRWLEENNQTHRVWLAIDDQPVLFPPNSPTLYLVNGKTGMTDADVEKIIERIKL